MIPHAGHRPVFKPSSYRVPRNDAARANHYTFFMREGRSSLVGLHLLEEARGKGFEGELPPFVEAWRSWCLRGAVSSPAWPSSSSSTRAP
jgi:hypothetical protein